MRKFIFPVALVLLLFLPSFSQIADTSKLSEAKIKLDRLQKELWSVDREQYRDITYLRKQAPVKGEFETTKEFEEREKKHNDNIFAIEIELQKRTGVRRQLVQKQINEILSTEFTGSIKIVLSKYDADNGQFTVSSVDNIPFSAFKIPVAEAKPLKDNFDECKISGSVGLLLDEKNVAREYLLSAKIEFHGKTYQVAPSPFTAVKALQMVFGNYDATKKVSRWETYQMEYEDSSEPSKATERTVPIAASSEMTLFKPYRENGVDKFLLVTNRKGTTEDEEMELTCHACSGLPSVATFIKTPGYWKVETAQKHAGDIGSYGSPGEPSLVKMGPDKYALKFSWGDMGMGYERGGEYYWLIAGGIIKEILNVYTSEDNTAAEGPKKDLLISNSKVTFVPGSNTEFFDVKIIKTGKKSVKIGRTYVLKPFSETEIYTFSDGKYQLVKK